MMKDVDQRCQSEVTQPNLLDLEGHRQDYVIHIESFFIIT